MQSDRNGRTRLETLIRSHHAVLPVVVFQRLSGCSDKSLRLLKQRLRVKGSFRRVDNFACSAELPPLTGLSTAERKAVKEVWTDLHSSFGRSERSKRMRYLIPRYADQIPTVAFARMFGVSESAVIQYMKGDCAERDGAALRRTFIDALSPPAIVELTDDEAAALRECWQVFQDEKMARRRQDMLLRSYAATVPAAAFGHIFGLTSSAVSARRRELELPEVDGNELARKFFSQPRPPVLHQLDEKEQRAIAAFWRREKAERVRRRKKLMSDRRVALVERLKRAAKDFRKRERLAKTARVADFACRAKRCPLLFPRTAEFFNRNRYKLDGLENKCKVCDQYPMHRPRRGPRDPGRKLTPKERARLTRIVRANATLIPSRILEKLFRISRNQLYYLRRDAEVKVTTAQAWGLYVLWMVSDVLPQTKLLGAAERVCAEELWKSMREAYNAALLEDDGRLGLQQSERTRILAEKPATPTLVCWGGYCGGKEAWPVNSWFFRRHTRCKAKKRRCHACANLEKRLEVSCARKASANG